MTHQHAIDIQPSCVRVSTIRRPRSLRVLTTLLAALGAINFVEESVTRQVPIRARLPKTASAGSTSAPFPHTIMLRAAGRSARLAPRAARSMATEPAKPAAPAQPQPPAEPKTAASLATTFDEKSDVPAALEPQHIVTADAVSGAPSTCSTLSAVQAGTHGVAQSSSAIASSASTSPRLPPCSLAGRETLVGASTGTSP